MIGLRRHCRRRRLPAVKPSKIVTTEEELEDVKAVLHTKVDVKRISLKDTVNYCNVLLDGNIRTPLCRFYFNSGNKFIGFFDEARKESKVSVSTIDYIYLNSDKLEKVLDLYLKSQS